MPSELENALARHRRALLANERTAASEMVRAYGESWARIRVDILRVQAQIAAGDTALWRVQQDARLASLQAQIEAELRIFAPNATQSALLLQAAAIDAAATNAGEAIALAGGPQVNAAFDKLNTGAVRALVGYASDGSPLRALFEAIGPDVAPRMTDTLAKGIALGWGPRVTARAMRAQYGVGLTRALLISRTETLRSYREATAQVYKAHADVLEGWIWVSACNRRTCASCWAMHGSFHTLDERLDDHPNGRCAMAPKVKDRPNRIGATGAERFDALSAEDQRHILGPGMWEAWQDGRVSLAPYGANSIVGRRDDAQWGTMRTARSLKDIVGADAAKGYSAAASGKVVKAAPVAARVMGPAGDSVGKYLDVKAKGKVGAAINESIAAIDKVHGVDALKTIPVNQSATTRFAGKFYHAGHQDTAIRIEVSSHSPHPQLTAIHEIGHYLDNTAIHLHPFRSQASPTELAWLDAVEDSKAFGRNADILHNRIQIAGKRSVYMPDPDNPKIQRPTLIDDTFDGDRAYTRYLLQNDELWARSYSQYVAVRSGDKILLTQLEEQIVAGRTSYAQQWEHDDFEPIAKAFDAIFEEKGWRK